jgi:hypothetical protein
VALLLESHVTDSPPNKTKMKTTAQGSLTPTPSSGDQGRGTGPRPRIAIEDIEITEAPEPPEPPGLHPSVAPESLRKPYSSLIPEKRISSNPRSEVSDRPVTPSMRTKPIRAICKKHKIAKGNNGECMLCTKEEAENKSGFAWKLILGLVFVAVAGAGIAALLR